MKDWAVCDPFTAGEFGIVEWFDTEEEADAWLRDKTNSDPDAYVGCEVLPKNEALAEYGS